MFIESSECDNLIELVKDGDLLVLANLLANGGIMDIYICHKGEVFIKTTHVTSEFFESTCNRVDAPNKESTSKVGGSLNTPLGKEIEIIDDRGPTIISDEKCYWNGNTNEVENEFGLSSEEEDDVEATENSDAEDNENIDLSDGEDGYGGDVHEELNIIKADLKA
ncbi:hypothetical protein RND71_006967 [Anisodus tanguticus]|uniref:Uncharacterized protein n=1 Tax=Anisodus tanguticus TaxID=243964 RepID=A0AAE1SUF0_9SOLA|nr:hypothetical protein RND71_006967 [Anisodus tanguticus]